MSDEGNIRVQEIVPDVQIDMAVYIWGQEHPCFGPVSIENFRKSVKASPSKRRNYLMSQPSLTLARALNEIIQRRVEHTNDLRREIRDCDMEHPSDQLV